MAALCILPVFPAVFPGPHAGQRRLVVRRRFPSAAAARWH